MESGFRKKVLLFQNHTEDFFLETLKLRNQIKFNRDEDFSQFKNESQAEIVNLNLNMSV